MIKALWDYFASEWSCIWVVLLSDLVLSVKKEIGSHIIWERKTY